WECKADMDNKYKFGEIAVNCEGYDYPDDPYILKGSCGLEYSLDYVGGDHGQSYDSRYDSHQSYHGNHDNRKHHRNSSGWMSTFIMWGVIAFIVYYIYTTYCANQTSTDGTQSTYQSASSAPPPPGFRPEYTQGHSEYPSTSSSTDSGYGGFWTGMGLGGLTGYLFGNRGYGNTGYSHRHGNPYYSQGDGWFGGNSWFGGNQGNTGWFGGNRGNTGWFGNGSSGWSSTHRRSGSSPSSSGSRTASGRNTVLELGRHFCTYLCCPWAPCCKGVREGMVTSE
ncbi:hypothetical protein QZH41_019287, partial [Actinostola sp. cb2023]